MRKRCVASHPFEIDQAITAIETIEESANIAAFPQNGFLQLVDIDPESYNTCYFDFEGTPEFVMFSVDSPYTLVIAGQYVFR